MDQSKDATTSYLEGYTAYGEFIMQKLKMRK
jgi:hypothetical protein